jgi:hypothetical protein
MAEPLLLDEFIDVKDVYISQPEVFFDVYLEDEDYTELILDLDNEDIQLISIQELIDSTLINIYLKEQLMLIEDIGTYKDRSQAIANGKESKELYFNWKGQLVRNLVTNMTLNFRRAFSFLRRLF